MNEPTHNFDPRPSHHSLDHLDEFSARQLDSFRVTFDPNQAASLRVLGNSYRHFVLLLDPIDWREEEGEVSGRGSNEEGEYVRNDCRFLFYKEHLLLSN